jgi:thiamine-phosphate diphosphorylase
VHLIGPLYEMTLDAYVPIAEAAASGGCDGIHVRAHQVGAGALLDAIRAIRSRLPNATVIVNDRLDLALLGDAAGVQLGEQSINPTDARALCGDRLLIGRSIHDLRGAQQAEREGADYLLAGHIYDTPSKAGQPGRGLPWLADICHGVAIPVIALGGISVERIPQIVAAGAYGVAMGREILHANSSSDAAKNACSYFDNQNQREELPHATG